VRWQGWWASMSFPSTYFWSVCVRSEGGERPLESPFQNPYLSIHSPDASFGMGVVGHELIHVRHDSSGSAAVVEEASKLR
jgi:hypothetical protein